MSTKKRNNILFDVVKSREINIFWWFYKLLKSRNSPCNRTQNRRLLSPFGVAAARFSPQILRTRQIWHGRWFVFGNWMSWQVLSDVPMWVSWCSIQKFAPSKLWSLWGSGRLGLHGDSVLLMMRCSPSFGWRNQLWISLDSFSKWGGKNKQENCFLWPQVPPVPCGQAYLEYPERGRKHLPYPTKVH